MAVKGLPDKVADLAMERVATLLADRVADRVVEALMKAGLIGNSLMRCLGLSRNKSEE